MAYKIMAASATDDAAFFAQLITGWIPKADQSKYAEGYTASDLMHSHYPNVPNWHGISGC